MRLTQVDQLILANSGHSYLNLNDICFFFGEFTIRENWSFSEVNQFIFNFKKVRALCKSEYELRHKDKAIEAAANLWTAALNTAENLPLAKSATLVPTPPSKAPTDPEYDDRIIRMLELLDKKLGGLDVRELVNQTTTYQASHTTGNRSTPSQLTANYTINEQLATPAPQSIWIFDDTLISGSHYKAMERVLNQRFPGVACLGMFLARGIHKV
jgi:hypothetical protein